MQTPLWSGPPHSQCPLQWVPASLLNIPKAAVHLLRFVVTMFNFTWNVHIFFLPISTSQTPFYSFFKHHLKIIGFKKSFLFNNSPRLGWCHSSPILFKPQLLPTGLCLPQDFSRTQCGTQHRLICLRHVKLNSTKTHPPNVALMWMFPAPYSHRNSKYLSQSALNVLSLCVPTLYNAPCGR